VVTSKVPFPVVTKMLLPSEAGPAPDIQIAPPPGTTPHPVMVVVTAFGEVLKMAVRRARLLAL
jgi:hypothetical protein